MRVLLADGDSATFQSLSKLLRPTGALLDWAGTGEAALGLLRHRGYDLVVLELALPDLAGHEVLRRVRAARVNTPALVLSRVSDPEAKARAFSAGADDFLAKPFDPHELLARVHAVLRRGKASAGPTYASAAWS